MHDFDLIKSPLVSVSIPVSEEFLEEFVRDLQRALTQGSPVAISLSLEGSHTNLEIKTSIDTL